MYGKTAVSVATGKTFLVCFATSGSCKSISRIMLPALNDVLFAAILICSLSYTCYYLVTQICRYLIPNVCLGLTHKAISFHASGIVAPAFPNKNSCFGLGLSLLRSTLCPYQTGFFSPWRLMCIPFHPFQSFGWLSSCR